MGFKAFFIEKMWALVEDDYKLYSNRADYLKIFYTS